MNGERPDDEDGSSPLARGLPRSKIPRYVDGRIIPARAGFTRRLPHHASPVPDHPRSRGVYASAEAQALWDLGSSPLARGLPAILNDPDPHRGIIPARAGFTGDPQRPRPPPGDHPRSRGVYAKGWAKGRRNHGIIPARAGFTRHRPQGAIQGQDHPRSRGVYAGRECLRPQGPGSSPLARGLPDSVIQPTPAGGGIIPARAGFTTC